MPRLIVFLFLMSVFMGCFPTSTKYPDNQPVFKSPDSLIYQRVKSLSGSKKIKIDGRKAIFFDTLFSSGLWVDIHYSYKGETKLKNDTVLAKILALELKRQLVDSNQYEIFSISLFREEKGWWGSTTTGYLNYFDKNVNPISAMEAVEPKPYHPKNN